MFDRGKFIGLPQNDQNKKPKVDQSNMNTSNSNNFEEPILFYNSDSSTDSSSDSC